METATVLDKTAPATGQTGSDRRSRGDPDRRPGLGPGHPGVARPAGRERGAAGYRVNCVVGAEPAPGEELSMLTADRITTTTCPYCGVGCGVIIASDGAQITGVRGDPDHPANFGRLCTKGSTLHLTATAA